MLIINIILITRVLASVTITAPSLTIPYEGFPSSYNNLGNIVILENAKSDFSTGTNITLILTAPANFEFNPGTGLVTFAAAKNITAASIAVTSTQITITYTCTGTNINGDKLTISGIQVKATTSSVLVNVTRTGGTGVIAGDAVGAIHAKLSADACGAPTIQSTAFTSSSITVNSMTIGWTRGNGIGGVIVVARAGGAVNQDPTNGTSYTANATFGAGSQIGTGNYVVYNGTGTIVIVTGLSVATTYYYAIYEYHTPCNNYNMTELIGNATTANCSPLTGNITISGTNSRFVISGSAYLHINGNLTISSSGLITNNGQINIAGNLTNSATFTSGNPSNVKFYGCGTTQQITTSTTLILYNAEVANTGGSVVLSSGNVQVNGVLTLTSGYLDLNSNILIINNSCACAIVRTSGYIGNSLDKSFSSKFQWNIGSTTGDHVFPFGVDASNYIPFTFNLTAGGPIGNVTISTYEAGTATTDASTIYSNKPTIVTNLDGVLTGNPGNAENIVKRFWRIEPTGTGTVTITFTYPETEIPVTGEVLNNMVAQRYNTTINTWESSIPSQTSNTTSTPNTVTVTGVTSFSPWAIAKMGGLLPIELISLNTRCDDDKIIIKWLTASETNNNYFTIERSADASDFEPIGTVNGAGNSNTTTSYQFIDQPETGSTTSETIWYYRLKQTDYDGKFSYSQVIQTSCNNSKPDAVNIFPNPACNELYCHIYSDKNGLLDIEIINICGQLLISKKADLTEGYNTLWLDITELTEGLYILRSISGDKKANNYFTVIK